MDRGTETLRRTSKGSVVVGVLCAVWSGCDGSPLDDSGRPLAWVDSQKLTAADLLRDIGFAVWSY